jgi:hypothetical protein
MEYAVCTIRTGRVDIMKNDAHFGRSRGNPSANESAKSVKELVHNIYLTHLEPKQVALVRQGLLKS